MDVWLLSLITHAVFIKIGSIILDYLGYYIILACFKLLVCEAPVWVNLKKMKHCRRKPQNLTPPLSSDSANSLSPRASPANKRGAGGGGADDPPATKKQRISHYRRPSPPSSGYATTSSGERHASDNEDDRSGKAWCLKYFVVSLSY